MVAGKSGQTIRIRFHFVCIADPAQRGSSETIANLNAFSGIDGHQCCGEVAVEFIVNRLPQTGWHTVGDHFDHAACGVAVLSKLIQRFSPSGRRLGIGAEKGVFGDLIPVPRAAVDPMTTHGHQRTAHDDRRGRQLAQDHPGDGTGGDPHRGLPGRRPTTAAVVAQAVLLPVGEISVARSELIPDFAVVLRALVAVVDDQPNG